MEVTKIQLLVKSVRLRSYSGPYSVRMRENADQNNFKKDTFYAVPITRENLLNL